MCSALSVYDALTEIASDENSESFQTTHAWIAKMSGASIRTVQDHIKVFVELGLITVATSKLRSPSSYMLLQFGKGCTTLSNGCRTFGNARKFPGLPTSEESEKNVLEESKNNGASPVEEVPRNKLPEAPKRQRPRNPPLDALATVDGGRIEEVTPSAWAGIQKALKEIKSVTPAVTAEEIKRRAGLYKAHMPGMTITAHALAKHWARCERLTSNQPPVRVGVNVERETVSPKP